MFFSKNEATEQSVPCNISDSMLNRKYFVGLVFVYHVLQLVNMCMLFIRFVCLSLIALNSESGYFLCTIHLEKVPPPTPHCFPF